MSEKIICVPGLGGHPSAFGLYEPMLKEFDFQYLEIVNVQKALSDLREMLNKEQDVILFCSCYGIRFALDAAMSQPQSVKGIVLIEPFFAEFYWWSIPGLWATNVVLWISRLTDKIGLRRKKINYQPDYVKLSKYPIYVQPIFDMLWQNITDYLDKLRDLVLFKLPAKIEIPTLIIFAKHGYTTSQENKNILSQKFVNGTFVELPDGTHNIITMSGEPISEAMRNWIKTRNK